MNDSTFVCARLLREGAILRAELPELDYPEVRAEVGRRLEQVGLTLASSAYSEYVGLRLIPEVTAHSAFDAASNLGLNADHCALLVVLWSYLSLQKRTASDSREVPGQNQLFARERADAARKYVPSVRIETIASEFKDQFGSYTRVKGLIGTACEREAARNFARSAIINGPVRCVVGWRMAKNSIAEKVLAEKLRKVGWKDLGGAGISAGDVDKALKEGRSI